MKRFSVKVEQPKRRATEKVLMDKFTRPKVFRKTKRELLAREAEKEIRAYLRGEV